MTRVRFPASLNEHCGARPALAASCTSDNADNSNCSRLTIAVPDHFVNRFSSNHTME
ncbi:Uncharacterised protein [Amycolatopsis camponoti]|uniref:Uncharacterized protein n=1 Tax=Amycolatopsis camponoti TaxID=2606593 RepID=A0A6I8LHJ1_9PSEU|nr:Uncharacterised protein [Amycolatopsis camponoti]